MSNLTDALIAAKLVGGSGGSGGGSGLPEIKTETVTILSEQSVAFSSMGGGVYMASIPGQYTLKAGSLITTVWEGVTYDRVIQDFGGVLAWGNLGIIGEGADTGEPFLMMYDSGNGIDIGCKSSGSHTVGLTTTATNYPDGSILIAINGEWAKAEGYGYSENGAVHQIDRKYIPFLIINVDTNNKTVDCSYLTYKSAVESGCPIWICDTEYKEYYILEQAALTVSNPSLNSSKWDYIPNNPQGSRLQCLVLNVLMAVGDDDWYVDDIIKQSLFIPGV